MTHAQRTIIEDLKYWTKYKPTLCKTCLGGCCTLPVEVNAADLDRMQLADSFLLEENPKKVAKQLKKDGIVEHYNSKKQLFTLARRADGSCQFYDKHRNRCTIYTRRPETCRNHPEIGPKPGYCPYVEQ